MEVIWVMEIDELGIVNQTYVLVGQRTNGKMAKDHIRNGKMPISKQSVVCKHYFNNAVLITVKDGLC